MSGIPFHLTAVEITDATHDVLPRSVSVGDESRTCTQRFSASLRLLLPSVLVVLAVTVFCSWSAGHPNEDRLRDSGRMSSVKNAGQPDGSTDVQRGVGRQELVRDYFDPNIEVRRRFSSLFAKELSDSYFHRNLIVVPAMAMAPPLTQLAFTHAVNAPIDDLDNRLLHLASRFGDHHCVWLLLKLGADPNVTNGSGRLPVDRAQQSAVEVRLLLLSASTRLSSHTGT